MKSTAWLFPGHGCQYAGMGRGFAFQNEHITKLFDLAESLSGYPLRELSRNGSAEQIRRPDILEPLLAAFSLSYIHILHSNHQFPSVVAGYSAGIIPALYSSGVIELYDAIALACSRGKLLSELSNYCPGQIITLSGPNKRDIVSFIASSGYQNEIEIAGWNSENNLSVVASSDVISKLAVLARDNNIKATYVATAGAWHSSAASKYYSKFISAIERIHFNKPRIPFYSSVTGCQETCIKTISEQLALQIHMPVLWQATLKNIEANESIQSYLEVGCGISLKSMYKPASQTINPPTFNNLYTQIGVSYA